MPRSDHFIHYIVTLSDSHMACGVQNAIYGSLQRGDVTCPMCLRKPTVSEKALQMAVLKIAREHSWLCYHTFDSRKSAPGFPDLVLCKPPKLLFAELKRAGQTPSLEQAYWLERLLLVPGVETYLWTPADMSAITTILEAP